MQELHKWNGLRLEIAEYCRDNQISKEDFRFIGEGLDANVIKAVCTRFDS